MNAYAKVPLGEICDLDRQGLRPDDPIASDLPFVGVEHVESESGAFNFNNSSRVGSQRSTTFRFDERHILYAKLRPYLNKVATPAFVGRCSTELIPLLPRNGVDREFIAYLLRRKETVEYAMASGENLTGARMPRTDMKALMSLSVPLPRLDEQRRIVGLLNRAAKVERLRAQAQELMGELSRSSPAVTAYPLCSSGCSATRPKTRWGGRSGVLARCVPSSEAEPHAGRIRHILAAPSPGPRRRMSRALAVFPSTAPGKPSPKPRCAKAAHGLCRPGPFF